MSTKWLRCDQILFNDDNDDEDIHVCKIDDSHCAIYGKRTHRIKIYNIDENEFKQTIIMVPKSGKCPLRLWQITTEFVHDKNIIYINDYTSEGTTAINKLYRLNLHNKSCRLQNICPDDIGCLPMIIRTQDIIHFINDHGMHFIYHPLCLENNNNNNCVVFIDDFGTRFGMEDIYLSIYLQSKNCILVADDNKFAQCIIPQNLNNISEYKWIDLKLSTPFGYERVGCEVDSVSIVATFDDNFVFIIQGKCSIGIDINKFNKQTPSIYVFDTKNNTCKKCHVEFPIFVDDINMFNGFQGIMIRNKIKDELLTFGFVNNCFKLNEFTNVQILPHYLIDLIVKYIIMEYIHIFSIYKVDINGHHEHWKISVDDLLFLT